jgi:hypothetical protein
LNEEEDETDVKQRKKFERKRKKNCLVTMWQNFFPVIGAAKKLARIVAPF